ncbi:MAG: extracellular solute-binding protein [Patescibacteria group bacterium]
MYDTIKDMDPQNTETITIPPVINQPAAPASEVEPPKKSFPALLIVIPVILLLIVGIFFAARYLISRFGSGSTSITSGEVIWWELWENQSVIGPLISEYEQSHPNVKINLVIQDKEDYRERLTSALAKGTGPDIFSFHNSWVPMFRQDLEPIPSSVMTSTDFSKNYYPIALSNLTLGAGIVGIPLEYDGLGLFINQDIFETQGKSIPTTWDDLRQTALALTIKDETGVIKQAGVALGRTENVDHWQEILGLMMLQNKVNLENPSSKNAEDALTFYTIFSSVDGVWDSTLPSSTQAFASGKLAMYFAPSWEAHAIKAINPSLRFKVVPVPQLPKDSPNEPNVAYATYWVQGVSKKSKNKALAWDFMKFIASRESLQKMYQNAAVQRSFGEPYPLVDMGNLVVGDGVVGGILSQAPYAQSWYLASRTFDGPTGINSQVSKYFEDAVNAVNSGTRASDALVTVTQGINQVLSTYGLTTQAQ